MDKVEKWLKKPKRISADRGLFLLFLGLLIWAPLPLGSNRPWLWSLLQIWVFALAIGWLTLYAKGRIHPSTVFREARVFLWLGVIWLCWIALQLIPLPIEWVRWLSPLAVELHEMAYFGETPPAFLALTADWYATSEFFLKSLSYMLVFALAVLLLRTEKRIRATIWVVVWCGVFQAVYGGINALQTLEVAHGTFVNRNHMAGYLEIALGVGLGLLMADIGDTEAATWRQRTRDLVKWLLSPKMRLRVLLAVMVVGLVLTRSRMGNSAFFASLLIVGGIWLLAVRKRSFGAALIVLISILLVDIYILGHLFGLEEVVQRLQETSAETENRDEVNRDMLEYLQAYPIVGSGGGTFYSHYPSFRGADTAGTYFLFAHNDYLQMAVETGVPGFLLIGLMVLTSLWMALKAIFKRKDPLSRGLGFGALMGLLAILIHSSVDFNLQIPANASLFMLLLALAWIGAKRPSHARGRRRGAPQGGAEAGEEEEEDGPGFRVAPVTPGELGVNIDAAQEAPAQERGPSIFRQPWDVGIHYRYTQGPQDRGQED